MKIVRTKLNGALTRAEEYYFGGAYSFWERLSNGGVGSNRVIYNGGLHDFDLLQRDVEGEIVYVNFELLPNGFIIRANCNQRLMILGTKISEIESIELVSIKIPNGDDPNRLQYRGEITITEKFEKGVYKFSVIAGEFKDLTNFFKAQQLTGKFKLR